MTTARNKTWGGMFKPPDVNNANAALYGVVLQNTLTPLKPAPPPEPIIIRDAPVAGAGGGAPMTGGSKGGGDVRAQLKEGFMSVGRKDLADYVDTPEFSTWIQQESGWDPNSTSPANNHGKPNYGLFQFWAGHNFARPGMSVRDQAIIAATKFNLSPQRIAGFANEIRRGSYKGWG